MPMKSIAAGFCLAASCCIGSALADTDDRTIAVKGEPLRVFDAIVQTASGMCHEAVVQGRTLDQAACVDALVAHAVTETGQPDLIAIAYAQRPTLNRVKLAPAETSVATRDMAANR